MQHPAFESPPRILAFAGSCLLVGLAVSVSQSGLVPVSAWTLILDGSVFGLTFGLLCALLWYVIRFAGMTGADTRQKMINYSALVVLVNLIWLGTGYLLLYIFTTDATFTTLTGSIPLKTVLGILIYTLVIRLLIYVSSAEKDSEEEQAEPKKTDSHKPGVVEAHANPTSTTRWLEKITVKVGQKIHVIAITDILFLQAEGDYVKIFTASSHYIKEQTMKSFEESLPSTTFVRIHRSVIVNVDVISRIELYEKQYYRITLQSGHQLKASTSGYKLLKNTLDL